jgi:hypothetical protein
MDPEVDFVAGERRRAKRVTVSTSFSESDPRTMTPVANLSRTGALLVGKPLHPIGARIGLRFVVFPRDPILFEHTGRVVRYLTSPPATGVEFDPMPPEVEATLERILHRAEAEATSPRNRRGKRVLLGTDAIVTAAPED